MEATPRLRSMTELWTEADEEKLGELLIYAAGQLLDDPTGGATKINKILYYSEFSHIRAHGVPITGVAYQKFPQGPAPRQLVSVRDRLIENDDAILRVDQYFGKPLHRLVPLRPQRVDSLSHEEMAIVDQVIKALWGMGFFAARVGDHIEILDFMEEEGYWDLVEDDPDD